MLQSTPGGPYASQCKQSPITHLPIGEQSALPSTLDYVLAAPHLELQIFGHWAGAPADHCILQAVLQASWMQKPRPKSHWNCSNTRDALRTARTLMASVRSPHELLGAAKKLQDIHTENRTYRQKRHDRVPPQARELFKLSAQTNDETQRQALDLQAARILRSHLEAVAALNVFDRVRTGRAPQASSGLKSIESLKLIDTNGESQCTIDHNLWAREIGDYFSCKWKANEGDTLQHLLVAGECQKLGLQGTDMLDLFSSIKHKRKMDANGVSVYALRFLCVASPAQFASCLEMLLTRTELCRKQCINGFVKGKGWGQPPTAIVGRP